MTGHSYAKMGGKMGGTGMAVVLGIECPHCRRDVAAEFVAEWVTPFDEKNMWTVAFKCVRCHFGIFVTANPLVHSAPSQGSGDLALTRAFQIMETYPKIPDSEIPKYLPIDGIIGNLYRQALDSEVRGNWDACGAMCRKVVDVSTVNLGASRSKKLEQRIDDLEANRTLTPALAAWAHAVRLDGNDASHDPDPFTEDEAHQIRSFTEIFLRYVYELPGMLSESKAQNSSQP